MEIKKSFEIDAKTSPVLPQWRRLTKEEKAKVFVNYAANNGGRAITLKLSQNRARYVNGHDKPMRQISKRMNKELRAVDLCWLPIFLILEVEKNNIVPHLHGVYVGNGVQKDTVQAAMRRAAGYVQGRSGSRQYMERQIYDAEGWSKYILKDCTTTRRLLRVADESSLYWVSRTMTQLARDDYETRGLGNQFSADFATVLSYAA
ncbi:hypothetical protein [Pararhodobacter oceanensis]|uniref:hypothetical protein n=1 Tax=Pararhodobacter oceanensis TaxID=2172121 RepID=UPI003A8F9B84